MISFQSRLSNSSLKNSLRKPQIPSFGKKYIYLIKSGLFYKIGNAKNLGVRLLHYKTYNPHELLLVDYKIIDNYKTFERKTSWKYREKNHRGEWFLLSKSDIKSIQKEWFF